MATYICLGSPELAYSNLVEVASGKRPERWTIHSAALTGDRALFYLRSPKSAIVATGRLESDAKKVLDRRSYWYGSYMAAIGNVELLPRDVGLAEIKGAFPRWRYWTQPRLSSRVPDELAPRLMRLLSGPGADRGVRDLDDLSVNAREGGAKWTAHLRRERSATLRNRKRMATLRQTRALRCEACGFDFSEKYGELGEGFCEIHHDRPLGSGGERITRLEDLAILCSNCHRMIHKTKPMLRVRAFRRRITD